MAEVSSKRLLLEGLVIVASILLAFAIDAGWDSWQEQRREARIVEQFRPELELYIRLFPAAEAETQAAISATEYLLAVIHGDRAPVDDSVRLALDQLDSSYRFAAATGTFELLAGDGNFGQVSSPELRAALAQLSSFISLVDRWELEEVEFMDRRLEPYLDEHGDRVAIEAEPELPASRFEWDPSVLLQDRTFSNLLVERRSKARVVQRFRGHAHDWATRALAALDSGG